MPTYTLISIEYSATSHTSWRSDAKGYIEEDIDIHNPEQKAYFNNLDEAIAWCAKTVRESKLSFKTDVEGCGAIGRTVCYISATAETQEGDIVFCYLDGHVALNGLDGDVKKVDALDSHPGVKAAWDLAHETYQNYLDGLRDTYVPLEDALRLTLGEGWRNFSYVA